ncbi:TIGR02301 family protein [Pelagibacterium sp. 26DY04]|uniref:TIGR02301 family protein n=1 Tax=Pelagibacterium sp. 26DY04 TaxID=2967130 RepID=UPI002816726A|nr:TIGR02301 family protein [Pelagibacterium sp. 26DY04]WMT87906.1 TIGR02301 family protein [Pelagibacterium sp. 26DY04]
MRRIRALGMALCIVIAPLPVLAVDPPYQAQMERLSEILGSLYMLSPLCGDVTTDWRGQMAELIELDEPDEDRRARLAGAFNAGYEAYARFYRSCTPSAQTAIARLLAEGDTLARDIHQRYAE